MVTEKTPLDILKARNRSGGTRFPDLPSLPDFSLPLQKLREAVEAFTKQTADMSQQAENLRRAGAELQGTLEVLLKQRPTTPPPKE